MPSRVLSIICVEDAQLGPQLLHDGQSSEADQLGPQWVALVNIM